jgi:phosphoglycerate dehydrogenase-like enzyme
MSNLTLLVLADPASEHLKILGRLPSETRTIVSSDRAKLPAMAPEADVILNADLRDLRLLPDVFPYAKRVRWVHSLSAGIDSALSPELIASPVIMTNGRGVFRRPLGEWVIAAMLFFSYNLRRLLRQQQAQRWEKFESAELQGRTLGIIGYGEIGRTAAELARPFGMRIVAVRRKTELSSGDPLLDAIYPPARMNEMLGECDFVVVAAPLTPETLKLVGAPQFEAMKPSAVIINVGRGPVIDEAAMIAALESGRIRGAGLDVFETEPLPAGNPLYWLENVLLSPHCADHTPGWLDRAVQFFVDNFERFRKGEPLQNVVDKSAGY